MKLQPLIDDLHALGYEKRLIENLTFIELIILLECNKRETVTVHGRYAGQVLALTAKGFINQRLDAATGKFICSLVKENYGDKENKLQT